MGDTTATVTPFSTEGLEIVQFQTTGLGDNSYLLRSGGDAVVVDPQRDVDRFRSALREHGARLVAVVETHVHNDYVSGGAALVAEFGAPYVVPADAGYELVHRPIREGDELLVGTVRLRALHTPGHTPHHMSYEVVDGDEVRAVFSGGSVLVGACGRTDLVSADLTESLTREQYRSAQRIGALDGSTTIGPTHGAGSFCAASAVSGDTWTTVAKERTRNPAFVASDEDDFVRTQLAGLLAYPSYYKQMAPINRRGAAAWAPGPPERLDPARLESLIAAGAMLVDGRPRRAFAAGHIPGSVNVELDPQFSTYLGWLFPFGSRFVIALDASQDPLEAVRQTARIGIETIVGVIDVESWQAANRTVAESQIVDIDELHHAMQRGGVRVLDVRQDLEWRGGHVPSARHIHVAELPQRAAEMDGPEPVYIYCATGHRAAMAASILQAAGIPAIAVDGGFADWQARGYPVA